jgi:hypothetical protein
MHDIRRLHGPSVAELKWAPDGIGAERRNYLQSKAHEAVFDDYMCFPSQCEAEAFDDAPKNFKPNASTAKAPSPMSFIPNGNPVSSTDESSGPHTFGTVLVMLG